MTLSSGNQVLLSHRSSFYHCASSSERVVLFVGCGALCSRWGLAHLCIGDPGLGPAYSGYLHFLIMVGRDQGLWLDLSFTSLPPACTHAAMAAHCLAQQPNSSRQWLNSLPWWGPQGPSHFLYLWTLGLEAPNHSHPHSYFRFLVCDFEGAITLWIGSSMIFILPNSQNFTATDVITV